MNPARLPLAEDAVVVDTDVVSFWQKGDSRGAAYDQILMGRTLVLSFQTVAELLRWAVEHRWSPSRRLALDAYLARFLVVPFTFALAREWAEVMAATRRAGRTLLAGDAWVAATARLYGVPLATHNRRHFANVPGLVLVSFAP